MKIGYARISKNEQSLSLQRDALEDAKCDKIIMDEISGSTMERPGLARLRSLIKEGDTVIVWRLDRLGRSLRHLIELVNEFKAKGVGFESIQEKIDTTTPTGNLIFHMFGALAEFELNLIKERTHAGLEAARARGRFGGRKFKLDDKGVERLMKLYNSREYTGDEMCAMMKVSRPTLYKYIRINTDKKK